MEIINIVSAQITAKHIAQEVVSYLNMDNCTYLFTRWFLSPTKYGMAEVKVNQLHTDLEFVIGIPEAVLSFDVFEMSAWAASKAKGLKESMQKDQIATCIKLCKDPKVLAGLNNEYWHNVYVKLPYKGQEVIMVQKDGRKFVAVYGEYMPEMEGLHFCVDHSYTGKLIHEAVKWRPLNTILDV